MCVCVCVCVCLCVYVYVIMCAIWFNINIRNFIKVWWYEFMIQKHAHEIIRPAMKIQK